MKKILRAALSVIMLLMSIAYVDAEEPSAAAEAEWTVVQNALNEDINIMNVSVTGDLGEAYANEKVIIRMFESLAPNEYAYLYMVWSEPDGGFNLSFLSDVESGEYILEVISDTMDNPLTCEIFIPSASKMDEILKGIEGTASEGKYGSDKLSQELSLYASEIGLWAGFSDIKKSNRKNIAQYIIDNLKEYTPAGLVEVFRKGVFIKGISYGESYETVEKILEMYNDNTEIKANELYKDYENLPSADKNTVLGYLANGSYNTQTEVENGFFKALSLKLLNNAGSFYDISDIMEAYSVYMGESPVIDKYNSLSDEKKDAAGLKIISNLKNIKTTEEFITLLEAAMKDSGNNNNSNTGVSKVSGGGGGYAPMPSTPSVPLNETETEDKNVFYDVPESHWAYYPIMKLYEKNIISGRTKNSYVPDGKITRAEFAKLLVSSKGLESGDDGLAFKDVSYDDWYYSYIAAAVKNGIIRGVSEDVFSPEANITRQDAAVMIARIYNAENIGIAVEAFKDDDSISDYAKQAVYFLKSEAIINGYNGSFNPLNNLTRAEAAQLINSIISK